MAIGDDAAAAGMQTVSGTLPANQIDTELNRTRDYIAQRTSTVTPIAKGGTGATTSAQARANLGITAALALKQDALGYVPVRKMYAGGVGIDYNNPTGEVKILIDATFITLARQDTLNTVAGQAQAAQGAAANAYAGNLDPSIYGRAVGGNSVYISPSGVLGHLPSARRWKKNIKDASIDPAAARSILVRSYRYKVAVDLGDAEQIGLIAEELEAAGFWWLVGYDTEGEPMTVHYDRVGLVALALAQHAEERLDDLTARVAKLEGVER